MGGWNRYRQRTSDPDGGSQRLLPYLRRPLHDVIFLRDGAGVQTDDTTSSAFPDYSHDTIWVGGVRGWLHKITGGFAGTPTEVRTGGFPVQLNPGNPTALASPVYDHISTNVFVGDYGGFLYRVSSTGVVTQSAQIDFGAGLVAGPVVDSTAGKVYAFSSSDGSTSCTGFIPCSAVYLFATNFGSGTSGTEARVGNSQNLLLIPIRCTKAASTVLTVLPSTPPATSTSAEIREESRPCIRFRLPRA